MKWLKIVCILVLIAIFCIGCSSGVKFAPPKERPTLTPPKATPAPEPAPPPVTIPATGPENPRYIYENGAIHVGGDGEPIELINNPYATDTTYTELVKFITSDMTNTNDYIKGGPDGYVCSDFAEAVHNNAEAEGIRAAWVGIDFEGYNEGHALNAFETADKGLVYIDCTGKLKKTWIGSLLPNGEWSGNYLFARDPTPSKPVPDSVKLTAWDTVAYIEVGTEYGRVGINEAKSLEYDFYSEYKQKWQDYERMLEDFNQEVKRYNQEVSGKVYTIGSAEHQRILDWEAELERERKILERLDKELGYYFYELPDMSGIPVKDIQIYWGNN